ncbi:MAG: GNAT family N-acetyltransferase [Actinobacteria bacterium]|nr:GNAT family N-acetyltransferase [Actinomycetota bacterium]
MNDAGAVVCGPLSGQGALAEGILRALPDWFGLEQALVDYAHAADELPTFVAARGGETVGFLTLKPTSGDAVEIHVMAVIPGAHRRGVGRALVERAATHARAQGFSMLHVKTLAPSDPHPPYATTRAFYVAVGFCPLEVLPQVWGPENPCLLMVMVL